MTMQKLPIWQAPWKRCRKSWNSLLAASTRVPRSYYKHQSCDPACTGMPPSNVFPLLRLGASVSQVGPSAELSNLLGLVKQLQVQVGARQAAVKPGPATGKGCLAIRDLTPKKAAPREAVAENEDVEEAADAESLLEAQSQAQADLEEKRKKQSQAPIPVATPLRNEADIPDAADEGDDDLEGGPVPSKSRPPASASVSGATAEPPVAVNSTTHKKEYMRLETWAVILLLILPPFFV